MVNPCAANGDELEEIKKIMPVESSGFGRVGGMNPSTCGGTVKLVEPAAATQ